MQIVREWEEIELEPQVRLQGPQIYRILLKIIRNIVHLHYQMMSFNRGLASCLINFRLSRSFLSE